MNMNNPKRSTGKNKSEPPWNPYPDTTPPDRSDCLVTIGRVTACVDIASFAEDLSEVDQYDFAGIHRPGWYQYDSEFGFFERTEITAWMPLPDPFGAEADV